MTSTDPTLTGYTTLRSDLVTGMTCTRATSPSSALEILRFRRCATCRLTYFTCPGHFGHIELASPVFHPLFMLNMYNLLRGTCLFCHKFKLGRSTVHAFCQGMSEEYQAYRFTYSW